MGSPTSSAIPLYETLTLTLTLSPSSKSSEPGSPEPYSVLRSEISLAPINPANIVKDSAAPDFLSLDFDDAGDGEASVATEEEAEPKTPEAQILRENEAESVAVTETTMESGWFRGNSRFRSPMLQLHKEIVDFCDFLSPTTEEQDARNIAIESVSNVIKYIWPNCKVEVFGSFRTGLYLPTSDIDVVILESGIQNPQPGLYALSRALSQKGIAKKIQVIAKARVPIVKFVEKKSGVSFDISFDVDNGPKAADFIKEAVSRWPPLRPLCLILKVFLHQRELNEVYSGGIGSYALLTMLMAMLQNLRDHQAAHEDNLGVMLIHFFDFYGRKLNTNDVGVSCNGNGTFFSKRTKGFMNQGRPFLLSIQDPQAPDNDIGKNSYNYFQVRSAFAMAYTTLTNSKTILSLGPSRSILGTIIRPDPLLIERKGGLNGDVTFNSLLPGAGEPLENRFNQGHEIMGNWQFDDEEEVLPRGGGPSGNNSAQSSDRKRKSSANDGSSQKKTKESGNVEERSSKKKMRAKKKKALLQNLDIANGYKPPRWTG